ncbi:uncharacterized protein [Chelonus insularis]|uniref:uncharacterized protein n=1 Tax=Chelonus insularis TaxID=460826 RepID=UPI00158F2C80|nr:uncharacterized protein LOC118074833 [Chelonus insularis]
MKSKSLNLAWNKNTIYALGLYKLITQSLGIWPLKCHDIFSIMRLVFVVLSQSIMAISLLSEINLDCGAVNDIIQMSSLAACNVLVLSKIFFIYRSKTEMLKILSSAIEEWQFVKNYAAFKIMKKNATLGRRVCILQMASAYLTVVLIALGSLPVLISPMNHTISENVTIASFQPLPLRTTCFYGEMSISFYVVTYIFQVIQLLITCTGNVGCDCFFFGITLHIAGQFENLVDEYKNFCVDTRMQMLISLRTGNTANVINIVIIYYVLNIQIFLYCYAGDRLTSGIASLQNAIYFSPWYNLPPKMNKNVIFIIFKASKTFHLTAGKILHMNIDNFKNILKATFSYFSFLQAMID